MMTATTLNTTGSNPTSTPSPLLWSTQFPETVLRTHVLGYLSLHERCSLFGMNRHLFFTIKPNYEQSQTHLVLRTATEAQLLHALKPPGLSYSWLTLSLIHNLSWKLHTLDLGPYCSDAFLQRFSLMQQTTVLPKVQHLAMARSVEVTDHGLAALSRHPTLQLVSLENRIFSAKSSGIDNVLWRQDATIVCVCVVFFLIRRNVVKNKVDCIHDEGGKFGKIVWKKKKNWYHNTV